MCVHVYFMYMRVFNVAHVCTCIYVHCVHCIYCTTIIVCIYCIVIQHTYHCVFVCTEFPPGEPLMTIRVPPRQPLAM